MNREENIRSIRPLLKLADTDKKPLELFQNETLRPILKLQQEFTYALLNNHKNYQPKKFAGFNRQQYEAFLSKYLQTNLDLKNQLLGAVIGLLSLVEFEFYKLERKELNRRIIQMQMKRFADTMYADVGVIYDD